MGGMFGMFGMFMGFQRGVVIHEPSPMSDRLADPSRRAARARMPRPGQGLPAKPVNRLNGNAKKGLNFQRVPVDAPVAL